MTTTLVNRTCIDQAVPHIPEQAVNDLAHSRKRCVEEACTSLRLERHCERRHSVMDAFGKLRWRASSTPNKYHGGFTTTPPASAHPPHRAKTLSRKSCMEAKLYRLLKRLAPAVRRATLSQHFTQFQRVALERWMLTHAKSSKASLQQLVRIYERSSNLQTVCSACPSQKQDAPLKSVPKTAGPQPKSGIFGVHSHYRKGKLLYRASTIAGPFRINTNYSTKLDCISQHSQVLRRIRDRVKSVACTNDMQAIEASFRAAISEEPDAQGCSSSNLRLYFYATISVSFFAGKRLLTPSFPVNGGLDHGLKAWQRLSAACWPINGFLAGYQSSYEKLEVALDELRKVQFDIWTEKERTSSAKLRTLEPEPLRFLGQRLSSKHCAESALTADGMRGKLLSRCESSFKRQAVTSKRIGTVERKICSLLERWARSDIRTSQHKWRKTQESTRERQTQ